LNVNPIVVTALASLGLPVTANINLAGSAEYITFNYVDERPTLIADDTDLYDTTVIQVHYFTKTNPQQKKKDIRRLLRAAGFVIHDTMEFYETDTALNHVVVECSIDGVIND
jgi:hypothetical protein